MHSYFQNLGCVKRSVEEGDNFEDKRVLIIPSVFRKGTSKDNRRN